MGESKTIDAKIDRVRLHEIRTDGGTQPRSRLDEETLETYIQNLQAGAHFPPVILFYDGEDYWLADGFHRVKAHNQVGRPDIAAEVKAGTRRDAILYSVGANATHGLRRSNADKRRAVETLLSDPDWQKWSDREIAARCNVSHPLVGQIRQRLLSTQPETSVAAEPRIARRGGKTYTVNTRKIGGRSSTASKTKRQRKEQTPKPVATVPQPMRVAKDDVWQLGERHRLFCGSQASPKFQSLLPDDIALLLLFPLTREEWLPRIPIQAKSVLAFHSGYFEDMHLETLRNLISNCMSGTTDSDDMVVMLNLPDPCSFLLIEAMDCNSICAEPSIQRCEEALAAWATSKQPVKKL